MDELVGQVAIDEGAGGCAQIAVVIGEPFELVVHEGEHGETANVKLALVIQGRFFDVLLNDERLLLVVVALADYRLYFLQGGAD